MSKKLMLTLSQKPYDELEREALERGTNVQGIIRIEVIPRWLKNLHAAERAKRRKEQRQRPE